MSRPTIAAATLALAGLFSSPAWAIPSTALTVYGQVATPTTFGLAGLQALPQSTQTETYAAAGSPVTDMFTGPTLLSVLNAAGGIETNSAIKNDVLQTYVVATGTDGYESVIATGEIAPNFGHKPDLVAVGDTGATLPGSAGLARVTASGDVAGGRYVSNIASLQVGHGPAVAGTRRRRHRQLRRRRQRHRAGQLQPRQSRGAGARTPKPSPTLQAAAR